MSQINSCQIVGTSNPVVGKQGLIGSTVATPAVRDDAETVLHKEK
ncbi:MAG TPA: hypothetical protein VGU63_07255 [Candidatus Acidoferrales bacterium]|nr:hypothetical protein [Candidatus Acidoferrales bacterium]